MYTITVTGSTALNIKAYVSSITLIDSNELGGEW